MGRLKKICFFSGDITRSGGTERVATMIANGLVRQGKYEIIFLSLTEQSEHLFYQLEETVGHTYLENAWRTPGPGYIKVIPKLRRFLKKQKIDVLIDIDIVLDSLSFPAVIGTGIKVVSWEHFNYIFERNSPYRRFILYYSVKRSDYIVTLTEEDKRAYRNYAGRRERISVIGNPMMEADIDGNIPKEPWLLTIGSLIYRKGIDYLLHVAVLVLKKYPDWKWIVAGNGEGRPFLEKKAAAYGIADRLILVGKTNDVGYYLKRAQIYVMTSRSEGLPMCLLEAKAFCLPVVSFDIVTGPAETVTDNVNGYLIPAFDCKDMAEKIGTLIEQDALRRKFSAHAQDDRKKFEMNTILKKWNVVLDRVCGEQKRGAEG